MYITNLISFHTRITHEDIVRANNIYYTLSSFSIVYSPSHSHNGAISNKFWEGENFYKINTRTEKKKLFRTNS